MKWFDLTQTLKDDRIKYSNIDTRVTSMCIDLITSIQILT